MSGPKVVRIVTREEIIAICEGLLRHLDQAIDIWTRDGKRIGEVTDEEIATTLERRAKFRVLLTRDAFSELQKGIPAEITFLNGDLERRRQIAINRAAQVRKRQRQGRDNASTLMGMLESRGAAIPLELHKKIQSIASGATVKDADVVLAQAVALLTPNAPGNLSDAQRDLVSRLMVGLETQDGTTWKSAQVVAAPNPRIERIDRLLAELQSLLDNDQVAGFAVRLRTIETTDAIAQQNLLLDSLILDLASTIENARAHRAVMAELTALAADLREYAASTPALFERIATCNSSTPIGIINETVSECKVLMANTQQRLEAEARRRAILQGLAQLGYEVNEGMETAWARDGQIVAKKQSLPGYGVEIGGQARTGRLQVRTVALTAERDVNRDKDAETIWCGEFARLQELLAEHGDNLVIERSMGVGTTPLKVISDTQSNLKAEASQQRTV